MYVFSKNRTTIETWHLLWVNYFIVNKTTARLNVSAKTMIIQSKKEDKDQESIQSSTTPGPECQWKVTTSQLDITNESQEASLFPTAPHLTQNTNGKVTTSQLDFTNESQEASLFPTAHHLTQNTNGKVTTSQLDITNESQEASPFPAGDHKASTNRRA